MMGVTIPSADIYGYLDDSDAPGTILEDEAQGMQKDMDKSKIYKSGYKKGAVVPRTIMMQNKRFIKYFRVFCLKACAAEEMPRVKGLLERFIFISMTEGYPHKDWADCNQEDEIRFQEIRNMLLKWRLSTLEQELPEVELQVRGRLKETWKPVLQIISGLTVEKDLRTHIDALQGERLSEKTGSLEGHLVKVICEIYVIDELLAFGDIWDGLVNDLDGKLDDKKPNKMDTAEFGEVTKQKIGYRLREVLGGKKTKGAGHDNGRFYGFDPEKLKRIAHKYSCKLADKRTTETGSTGVNTEKHENQVNEKQLFSQMETNLEIQRILNQLDTPQKVVPLIHSSAEFSNENLSSISENVISHQAIFSPKKDEAVQ
jgi:hypothetical protein